jgi:tRNA (guanosine-2'-O-)-methyltransferase
MTGEEQRLLEHFAQFISDHKKDSITKILQARTRHLTVVLEDIFQSQNASAVIRTCECMGLQDVYIVENKSKYHLNTRVLKGADKWLNLVRHRTADQNNTATCFEELRAKGYKILVADPGEDGVSIHDVDPVQGKLALLFGNELRGVSDYAIDHADVKIRIPMFGFTESLNISVSVAICLNSLITKLRSSEKNIELTDEERNVIRLQWYRKIVRRSGLIEREFLRTIQ